MSFKGFSFIDYKYSDKDGLILETPRIIRDIELGSGI